MRNVCLWNSTLWRRFSFRRGVAYDNQTCQSTCGGHCVWGVGKFGRSNGDGQGRWGRPWRWRLWRGGGKILWGGGGEKFWGGVLWGGGHMGGGGRFSQDKYPGEREDGCGLGPRGEQLYEVFRGGVG